MSPTVIGLDGGLDACAEVEHLLTRAQELCGSATLGCTHTIDGRWVGSLEVGGPTPSAVALHEALGVAVAVRSPGGVSVAGPPAWRAAALQAAQELAGRTVGRAVLFGGQDALVGVLETDDVVGLSAIELVVGVAGTPTAGTRLVTREFVRPRLVDGRLVLHVRPFGGGTDVAPFEVPNPTPCCAAHG